MQSTLNKHRCPYCGQGFPSTKALSIHIENKSSCRAAHYGK